MFSGQTFTSTQPENSKLLEGRELAPELSPAQTGSAQLCLANPRWMSESQRQNVLHLCYLPIHHAARALYGAPEGLRGFRVIQVRRGKDENILNKNSDVEKSGLFSKMINCFLVVTGAKIKIVISLAAKYCRCLTTTV